jgi:hypothetical protein
MTKTSKICGFVVLAAAGSMALPFLVQRSPAVHAAHAVTPVEGAFIAAPPPADNDLPQRMAHEFAPFLRAIVTRRINQAEQIFKMRRSVLTSLEQPNAIRILGHFNKPDQLELNLIGGRMLGNSVGTLLFTISTQEGPVAFKIFHYGFDKDIYIGRLDVTDDWDEIERLAATVDPLPQPVTVNLGGEQGQ